LCVLFLNPFGLPEVAFDLCDFVPEDGDGSGLLLEQVVEVVEVVLDVAANLVGLVAQVHFLLGELDGLVDLYLMLLYQFLLLLQDQLNVLVVLLTQQIYFLLRVPSNEVVNVRLRVAVVTNVVVP